MKNTHSHRQTLPFRLLFSQLLPMLLILALPVQAFSAPAAEAKNASGSSSAQMQIPPAAAGPFVQITPELLAQIDTVIDQTVQEALEAQRQAMQIEMEALLSAAVHKNDTENSQLIHSRSLWRKVCAAETLVIVSAAVTGFIFIKINE